MIKLLSPDFKEKCTNAIRISHLPMRFTMYLAQVEPQNCVFLTATGINIALNYENIKAEMS